MVEGLAEVRDGQERMRVELTAEQRATNARLDDVTGRLDQMNGRLERIEHAAVGAGRMSALEARVKRLEERTGLEPER